MRTEASAPPCAPPSPREVPEAAPARTPPLNGMLGMCELALDCAALPEDAAAFLKSALRCGDHLLVLINDLLDFQRTTTRLEC
eukprot:tig00000145_g8819.t1